MPLNLAGTFPDTLYPRISPTSFYPLMAGAATDEQAGRMVREWLLSPRHFCISSLSRFRIILLKNLEIERIN